MSSTQNRRALLGDMHKRKRTAPGKARPVAEVLWSSESGVYSAVLLAEERQDRLSVRVGDRQRLDAELLLDLERLQAGRFHVHVGIDELADAAVERVHQRLGEALLDVDALLGGAER